MTKPIYNTHVLDVYHFMFYCRSCGKLNVRFFEYRPYLWEECQHCFSINCVCLTVQDEQEQDKINGDPSKS